MKKRILAYLTFIDKILAHELPATATFDVNGNYETIMQKDIAPTRKDYEKLLTRHLEQITFFRHERLIHLLVTLLFALLTFATCFLCVFFFHPGLLILFVFLLVLLIPYIMHYYTLENGVQKMYAQYDEIIKRMM